MARSAIGARALAAVASVIVLIGGCASDAPRADGLLWTVVSTPAASPLDPSSMLSGVAGESRYRGMTEDGPAAMLAAWTERSADGRWVWRACEAADAGANLKTLSEERLRLGEDGSVQLERSIEQSDDAETVFEPALVTLPAGLEAGATRVQEVRMTVRVPDRPARVRAKGPAEHEVTVIGGAVIRVGGREYRTVQVRGVLRAHLAPAEVVATTDSWWSVEPGRAGLVAQHRREEVRVLGILTRSVDRRWGLESTGRGAAGALIEAIRSSGSATR